MSLWFTLRAADLRDAEGVARLCERADRAPWPAAVLAPHPDRCSLVAIEGDGALIGVAKTHLHVDDDPPAPAGHYLGGIVVDPAWRRRGVGTALTLARLDWVSQRAAAVYYFTNVRNAASLALHARLASTRWPGRTPSAASARTSPKVNWFCTGSPQALKCPLLWRRKE
ncbi:GNAT family N-acetyltransferase [Tessaracoccus flavescens]|uniref:N-acetyltransferase domain-containing protein n=1 Tax=Tessaracoccus flavescens TaxID=399497 RepID=A0A1Q2CZ31_9ACTN|nr:GNAT family N-acetyltransferase [Tessaracoccus flavescens]AQP51342.1 hypothetical protein BW733_11375 [Tessaracoccus flavescens]